MPRFYALISLVAAVALVRPATGQGLSAEEALVHYADANGVTFITETSRNISALYGPYAEADEDLCAEPPPPTAPYSTRADLDGDGSPDAAALGLRDSTIVLVVCLSEGGATQCYEASVGSNEPFRYFPPCSSLDPSDGVLIDGHNGYRLTPVEARELARWRSPVWPPMTAAVRVKDSWWSALYFCVSDSGLHLCKVVN